MRIDRHLMIVLGRLVLLLVVLGGVATAGMLITYEVIGVEWLSTMENQVSLRPMEKSLPMPERSVPIEGAAYAPGTGTPLNPVPADEESISRGEWFYQVNCALCHGESGKGDGPMSEKMRRKPADLTGVNATGLADGDIFIIITHGMPGTMPSLIENLDPGERWDVVNYVRTLK